MYNFFSASDERFIKLLLEMIPRHIDAMVPSRVSAGQDIGVTIGREVKTSVWEELASCFLKVSNYFQGRIFSEILSERVARATWKTRFRWWKEKHFREISVSSQVRLRMSEHASISGTVTQTCMITYSVWMDLLINSVMLCFFFFLTLLLVGASNADSDLNKPQGTKWEDHYECDPNNENATCNYCNMNVNGGIQRMKEHLIGKKRFIEACNNIPQHTRTQLKKLWKGKDREKEQSIPSILPLLPGMMMKRLLRALLIKILFCLGRC